MLAIAILSLIGLILMFFNSSEYNDNELIYTIITVIAWWYICLSLAIILLVFGVIILLIKTLT